jgi:hypothetical protein
MRKILFIALISVALGAYASDSLQVSHKYRRIYFFTAGLQAYSLEVMNCRNEQAKKMSFGYKRKAGCVVGPIKWLRIQSHNKHVEHKMVRRFGTGWRKSYEALLRAC